MSVQINQYVMYGVKLPGSWIKGWEERTGKKWWSEEIEVYHDDSAYKPDIGGKDGLFALYDGYNGKYVVIGEVLQKTTDGEYLEDMEIPVADMYREHTMREKIETVFGPVDGELKHYVITNYR